MRLQLMFVCIMLSVRASAEEHKDRPRWNLGAKLAVAGASVLANLYVTTVAVTAVGDGFCGLNSPSHCEQDPKHGGLYIPVVGGFVNAAQSSDTSTALGIASSVLQTASLGLMIAGIVMSVADRPHPRPTAFNWAPLLSLSSGGVSGRF
jgi:hypothetical protein